MPTQTFLSLPLASFRWFGIAGSLIIILSFCITGLFYRGKDGRPYSIFNHFISELGEVGVSRAAAVFNIGLMLGGAVLVPFCIALGLLIPHWLAYAGMAAGLWAAVSCILVGIFPMNNIQPHTRAALSFFRSGLVMVFFFSLAIFFQPAGRRALPLTANIPGFLAFAAFAGFLSIPWKTEDEKTAEVSPLQPDEEKPRPRFWLMPFLEWLVFFTTIAWFLFVALMIR